MLAKRVSYLNVGGLQEPHLHLRRNQGFPSLCSSVQRLYDCIQRKKKLMRKIIREYPSSLWPCGSLPRVEEAIGKKLREKIIV